MANGIRLAATSLGATSERNAAPFRRGRVSDRRLLAAKIALLAAVAATLALSIRPPLPRVIVRMDHGIEFRCPWGWGATWAVLAGAEVRKTSFDTYRAYQRTTAPCAAVFCRLAWSDFERLCELALGHGPERGWRDDETRVLAEVARYLDLGDPMESVTRARLGARAALAVSARRFDGYAELVVAPGTDLVYFLFYLSDEEAWRRALPVARVMPAAVRLRDSGPVTPLWQRSAPPPSAPDAW